MSGRLKLPIVSYDSSAEGVLEFVDGGYQFTKVLLRPHIVVGSAEAAPQVQKTLEDAHESCLISNSVNADVTLDPNIVHADE